MTTRNSLSASAAVLVLFLAGCGSTGGLGDILGGGMGTGTGNGNVASEIRGTVDQVDTSSRSLVLTNVSNYNSRLNDGGNSVRVYFNDRTTVEYQGRSYRPEDLERGDEVAVRLEESGNRLVANSMTVLRNSGGNSTGGNYGSNLRGTVRYVDSSRRTIELDRGSSGQGSIIEYDNSTYVSYGGRRYRPEELERGDEIEIRTRRVGSNRIVAEDITVLRSVSGNGSYGGGSSSRDARVTGTVRFVDGNRRTIELDQINWVSGFRRNTNSSMVQYDTNTVVEFQGQTYPPSNLERGDVVEMQVREGAGSTLITDRIILVRDVNSR